MHICFFRALTYRCLFFSFSFSLFSSTSMPCILYGSQLKMIIFYVSTYICILYVRAKSFETHATYRIYSLEFTVFAYEMCVRLRANMGMSTKLTTYFIAYGIESIPSVQNKMLANKNDSQVTYINSLFHGVTEMERKRGRGRDTERSSNPNNKNSPHEKPNKSK